MKSVVQKWQSLSLVLRIAIGLVIGIILALLVPGWSWIAIFGQLFTGALKAIAPILVFFLVSSSLSKGVSSSKGVLRTIIVLYMLSTLIAALVAVLASHFWPVTLTLGAAAESTGGPNGIGEVLENMMLNIVSNPVDALVNANYIGILFWAVLFGIALRHCAESTQTMFENISSALTKIVGWIIQLAPFGIMGLVFTSVSDGGLSVFGEYGRLLMLLVGCMLFIYFVTNPILVWWCTRENPYPLIFRCLRRSAITAFFTRSSAANIPVNMEVAEELGLNPDVYSVSLPLGATINMDGAAITITVMTLAAANTLGIQVDFAEAILLSILATVSACGASGVAGGSLLLIPLACSMFGISNDIAMQVVGIGFIISVIQDSVETALNSSSDLIITAAAEFRQWRKEGKKLPL